MDILKYLAAFGKFPFQDMNWKESDLNFSKLQTETKFEYFINYDITYCPSPIDGVKILCLEYKNHLGLWNGNTGVTLQDDTIEDIKQMFKALGFPTDKVAKIVTSFETSLFDRDVKVLRTATDIN